MLYRQIGTITNQLTKVVSSKSDFETLALTQVTVISDNEDKQAYKRNKSINFISGEFSEEDRKPITRNNDNLYYRELVIIDIENTGKNNNELLSSIKSKLEKYKYLLYQTLNHTEEKPRYRLILEANKKMKENEYKATIMHVMAYLGLNFDNSSFTFSQVQGSPVTTASKKENYIFIKKMKGKKIEVQKGKDNIYNYNNDYQNNDNMINHEIAINSVNEYVKRNSQRLEQRNNYISCLMVICKAVLTQEIEYSTGLEASRLLANNNASWELDNQQQFNSELKRAKGNIKYFKTSFSFRDMFLKEKKIKRNNNVKISSLTQLENIVTKIRKVKYNELSNLIEIEKDGEFKTLDNREIQLLKMDISKITGITVSIEDIKTVLYSISEKNKYHAIKEIIEREAWDGVPRAENIFIKCLGVEDTPYNREVSRKWLLACIYRLYEKGCKFDEMIILYGGQGIGKSTTLERLAMDFYTKVTGRLTNDTILQTSKSWLVELDELSTLLRTPSEEFKAWLSSRKDTTRPPYEGQPIDFPRGFVVLGTTNNKEILKDYTGNRRYWILEANKEKIKIPIFTLSENYIVQLWSEVLTWYKNKESLLLSEETRQQMELITNDYVVKVPFQEEIKKIITLDFPKNWKDVLHSNKRFKLHKYVSDILNNGASEEYHNVSTKLEDITTQELYYLLTGNYRTTLHGLKETKYFSLIFEKIDNWEFSYNIKRNNSRLRGYRRRATRY